jgi:hypothetical protein
LNVIEICVEEGEGTMRFAEIFWYLIRIMGKLKMAGFVFSFSFFLYFYKTIKIKREN